MKIKNTEKNFYFRMYMRLQPTIAVALSRVVESVLNMAVILAGNAEGPAINLFGFSVRDVHTNKKFIIGVLRGNVRIRLCYFFAELLSKQKQRRQGSPSYQGKVMIDFFFTMSHFSDIHSS